MMNNNGASPVDTDLAWKICKAKTPKIEMKGDGKPILDLDGDQQEISMDDADLLFRTMFFRGKF